MNKLFISSVSDLTNDRYRVKIRENETQKEIDLVLLFISKTEFYIVDAICPHSGGPLFLGDIEDYGKSKTIVCPYHQYEFELSNGNCLQEDFQICSLKVEIIDDSLFLLLPNLAKLLSLEPITRPIKSLNEEVEVDLTNLCSLAVSVLLTSDPEKKYHDTIEFAKLWKEGLVTQVGKCIPPDEPPREAAFNILPAQKTIRRGKGGTLESRIAILHALANIEQWAIDLAWDIIARFSQEQIKGESLPKEFFDDFVQVAADEAKHFSLISNRLLELGSYFGALPIHKGLWESATITKHDLLVRLAIVHMVHEARGLDVNPNTISRFQKAGDLESVRILNDEITHVSAGHRWFSYICDGRNIEKVPEFQRIVSQYFFGPLKPPFNEKDREQAGLSEEWYMPLSIKSDQ